MSTENEQVVRCDICKRKTDVEKVSAEMNDMGDGVIFEAKDFCEDCKERLVKFIGRGMNKPGWQPDTK